MVDLNRGRTIFNNLVDYPLPQSAGVRDYVFYLVKSEAERGYGWSSRRFFRKWYKNHHEHEVSSLEELIRVLDADVTQPGVQKIREIVIVTHANAQAMLFPILANGSATAQQRFPYVNHITLVRLRQAFKAQEFPDFKEKRDRVIAHFKDDSWITIRACNFGNSRPAMYATYSFFGGRANVYAPKLFQFFAIYPMQAFRRLDTFAKLHSNLAHQHFLPKAVTPERKKAIVEDLVDPVLLSKPFKLASMPLSNPQTAEEAAYEGLVDDLNAVRISAPLREKIAEMMTGLSLPDWTLSDATKIFVKEKNVAWLISEPRIHESIAYHIHFLVGEKVEADKATLWVQAQLLMDEQTRTSDRVQVEVQLFLDQFEDDILHGRVLLAGYTDKDEQPHRKTRFNTFLRLLQTKTYAEGDVSLLEEFRSKLEVEPPPQPNWVEVSPLIWKLPHPQKPSHYLIKVEHPATSGGVQAHTIGIYKIRSDQEYTNHLSYLVDHVKTPDTPGTELAAYFDRFSIDELLSVVAYLRTPFKPGNSLYIDHAQQAITRKKGFQKWLAEKHPELFAPNGPPFIDESEWELRTWERDDKRENSNEFSFNSTWAEVKASDPSSNTFQADLFLEEDLAQVRKIQDDGSVLSELDTDSPLINVRPASQTEAAFASDPSVFAKRTFDEEEPTATCTEFEELISEVVAMPDLDVDDLRKRLEKKTDTGFTYFDVLQNVAKSYSFLRDKLKLKDKLPWIPSSPKGLLKDLLKRELDIELAAWIAGEGEIIISTTLLQSGLALIWVWTWVITPPGKMLLQIVDAWESTDQHWEALGELAAMRQWLRRVEDVTYKAQTVPDLHEIDVATPVSTQPSFSNQPFANAPYHIGRFYLELLEEDPRTASQPLIISPDRLKAGFDRGINHMKFKVADELVRRADRGVNEAFKAQGLDSCQVRVLIDLGVINVPSLVAQVIGNLAEELRNRLPRL